MRHFQEANLLLPVRPLAGPSPHDVVWQPASNARILQVLKNPACAGAYVMADAGAGQSAAALVRRDARRKPWRYRIGPVCLKDAFPGYIAVPQQ
jgi:hypothetical protein